MRFEKAPKLFRDEMMHHFSQVNRKVLSSLVFTEFPSMFHRTKSTCISYK